MNLNKSYVKKQCSTEYRLFCNTLRNKNLTNKQLVYLHNAVLLPKVEYRLKRTILTRKDCDRISAPFRSVLKHALHLTRSFPTDLIQYRSSLNLFNLFQRNLTQHCSRLALALTANLSNTFTNIFFHRLFHLQKQLYISHSPLVIDNFSIFSNITSLNTDIIFSTIKLTSEIGIHFALLSKLTQHAWRQPIHDFFDSNPKLYAYSIKRNLLQRLNITTIGDCFADNGVNLLNYSDIARKYNAHVSGVVPLWYKRIQLIVTGSTSSLRLLPQFIDQQYNQQTSLSIYSSPTPLNNARYCSFWCVTWDNNNSSFHIYRAFSHTPQLLRLQHWIPVNPDPNHRLTPQSAPIQVRKCSGCHLHNENLQDRGGRSMHVHHDPHNCRIEIAHNQAMLLESQDRSNRFGFSPIGINTLRISMFTLRHDASQFFNAINYQQIPEATITTGFSEIKPHFKVNDSYTPITSNLRYFMNDCFDAYTFNNIINLSRFKDILTWHNDKLINWNTTWSLLTSPVDCNKKSHTSFKQSSAHAFSLKLMANELPLLRTLQTIRNPDLYDPSWKCPVCDSDIED
jgi:hypothetical protein